MRNQYRYEYHRAERDYPKSIALLARGGGVVHQKYSAKAIIIMKRPAILISPVALCAVKLLIGGMKCMHLFRPERWRHEAGANQSAISARLGVIATPV